MASKEFEKELILQAKKKSAKEFPPSKQECTCKGEPINRFIQCRKHLSRYFKNQGCYWCNDTDCSNWRC